MVFGIVLVTAATAVFVTRLMLLLYHRAGKRDN